MPRYAIVEDGNVVNVVLWDGSAECDSIPEDAIELPDDSPVGPGYSFGSDGFVAPPAPAAPSVPIA